MPRWLLIVAALLVVLLAAAQFVPARRTNPPARAPIRPPAEVGSVIDRCCGDCHSNRTRWPFYARVAPVSWLVLRDVKVGRENLNFSYWEEMTAEDQKTAARLIVGQISSRGMPLWYYLLLHPRSRPTAGEIDRLRAWFSGPEAAPGPRADSLGAPAGGGSGDDELYGR